MLAYKSVKLSGNLPTFSRFAVLDTAKCHLRKFFKIFFQTGKLLDRIIVV